VSLGIVAVAAQSMLWLGAWEPRAWLYVLSGAGLLILARTARPEVRGVRYRADDVVAVSRATRLALGRVRGDTAGHAITLVVALVLWLMSLGASDLGRMGGLGLLQALPPAYFAAFALVLVGYAVAAASDKPDPRLLGAYVVALILLLHATTALLYDEPRYAWTYKHIGVINLIAATGHTDRQIDVYNNWPAFFAANAWVSKTAGVAPILYAGWAQLFFNLIDVVAVRFALRAVTCDERVLWTSTFFFVLGNWVGQDYLAPQAFGFTESLIVLGLCLRCARARRLDPPGPPPLGSRVALAAGGICFLAVVVSHQLSPLLLIVDVAALAILLRALPLWIPAAMVAMEAWWLALAWPFLQRHFVLFDPGGGGGASAPGRDLAHAPPGAALSFYAPPVVMIVMTVLAGTGLVRRWRTGRRDLVAVCLVVTPGLVVTLQSYGGEGPYRAYLFSLPWLALLAAFACLGTPSRTRTMRLQGAHLLLSSVAISTCLLFAYFGQELANHIPPDDVRAAGWYEEHAPPGALRINLAPNAPDRLTSRYPLVSLSDPPSLLEEPGFAGHRLGAAQIPRLESYIRSLGHHRAYAVLTLGQENYARLNGLLPSGSVGALSAALQRSDAFRLVYRRPTAWIFAYVPADTAPGRAGHHKSRGPQ
jgi:hypothetical protein